MIKKFFQVDIGVDQETKRYVGMIMILSEKKGMSIEAPSMKTLLPRIRKALVQKDKQVRMFPLPEESLIVMPNSSKVIVASR